MAAPAALPHRVGLAALAVLDDFNADPMDTVLLHPVDAPVAHVAHIMPTVMLHIYQALRQGKDTL